MVDDQAPVNNPCAAFQKARWYLPLALVAGTLSAYLFSSFPGTMPHPKTNSIPPQIARYRVLEQKSRLSLEQIARMDDNQVAQLRIDAQEYATLSADRTLVKEYQSYVSDNRFERQPSFPAFGATALALLAFGSFLYGMQNLGNGLNLRRAAREGYTSTGPVA